MRIYRFKKIFTVQFNRVTCLVCNWKHARTDRVKDHVKSVHRILTPTFQVHYRDSFEDGMYESMNFLRSWHRRNNDKRSESLNSWPNSAFTLLHFLPIPCALKTDNLCLLYWKKSKIWAGFNCCCVSGKIIERWKVHLFAILFTFSFFFFLFQICKDKCSKNIS